MVRHTIVDQLVLHEGLRQNIYKCPANDWTIGVGRNLETKGLSPIEQEHIFREHGLSRAEVIERFREGKTITKEEAIYLLENDIRNCKYDLNKFPWFKDLDSVRQKVLIDMRFNLGNAGFLGFKKMIKSLEEGDYTQAGYEMKDSRWYRQVGDRGKRLVRMMVTGEDYTN